jgi:hypothetical protein
VLQLLKDLRGQEQRGLSMMVACIAAMVNCSIELFDRAHPAVGPALPEAPAHRHAVNSAVAVSSVTPGTCAFVGSLLLLLLLPLLLPLLLLLLLVGVGIAALDRGPKHNRLATLPSIITRQ